MISNLAAFQMLSPNHSGKRTHVLDRITPHCFVGQVTAKRGCEVFLPPKRRASCNYVIGYDGTIGACVDEDNRSWCTSSSANDQRAITIEIASGTVDPYEIRDAAYDSLKALTVDIMQRHDKNRLVYIPDKNAALAYEPKGNELLITEHRWFANKACPGRYIISVLQDYTDAVNRELAKADLEYNPIYRVQVGAFRSAANARRMLGMVKDAGFTDAYINISDGLNRVQVGAYSVRDNALNMLANIKAAGFEAYVKESVS